MLERRKGFVRLAVAHGAALVPVFGAGVTDLYTTSARPRGHASLREDDARAPTPRKPSKPVVVAPSVAPL